MDKGKENNKKGKVISVKVSCHNKSIMSCVKDEQELREQKRKVKVEHRK